MCVSPSFKLSCLGFFRRFLSSRSCAVLLSIPSFFLAVGGIPRRIVSVGPRGLGQRRDDVRTNRVHIQGF